MLSSGGSTLGPGDTGPPNLAQPPPQKKNFFLDTVSAILVELIGSIVISLKFRLAVCSEISCNVKLNVYLAMKIPDCVSFVSG